MDVFGNKSWKELLNSTYFDECADNSRSLLKLATPVVDDPSKTHLKEQWDFVSRVIKSTAHINCSDFVILGKDEDGTWQTYNLFRDAKKKFSGNPGSWGIVLERASVKTSSSFIYDYLVGKNIANVLVAGGLVPKNMDKILCIGYLLDDRTNNMVKPEDIPMPVLYSSNTSLKVKALLPAGCVSVNESQYEDFNEKLHVWPGYAKAMFEVSSEARSEIDAYYAGWWRCRIQFVLDAMIETIVPVKLTKKQFFKTREQLEAFLDVLCCFDGKTPQMFRHDFFDNVPEGGEHVAPVFYNELSMSPDLAQEMVGTGKTDLSVIDDVLNIWKNSLARYRIGFNEMSHDSPIDEILECMTALSRDLGIEHAVHSYFDGVPVGDILA